MTDGHNADASRGQALRVLILNHVTARSGGEIALLRLLQLLDPKRFDVVVALPSLEGMLPEELAKIPGVRVRAVPVAPELMGARRFQAFRTLLTRPWLALSFVGLVWRVARLVRDTRAEVILTNSIKSDFYGALAGALTNRPVVWYVHDLVDAHYFPGWARKTLVWFGRVFPAHIICVSDAVRNALVAAGMNARRVSRSYIPLPAQVAGAVPGRSIREELSLPAQTRLVTMVGRITMPKGQLEFVRAGGDLLARMQGVTFLIVGDSMFGAYDDDYKKQVETEIRGFPEARRALMLGMRTDAMRIMKESDVIVFPSKWPEGLPLSVAEAMSLGRPLVATVLGGTAELIEDGVTGLRVEPGDVPGLSLAIARLLDDPELARRLGQAGRQRVTQLLAVENVRNVEDILERTARSVGPAPR